MILNDAFNLLTTKWFPVIRKNGQTDWIAPHQITEHIDDPERCITALNAPRPDFNGALQEFLIGLLTTCCMQEDIEDWRELWETPPLPAWLAEKFSAYQQAFNLDGNGPSFMQDFDELEGDPVTISNLLIGEPADNTVNSNKDLFQKRNRITALSRPAAAMALFTLQCYAPSGGQGHRTSMRGGGPLTTLVSPDSKAGKTSLWHNLWANVETAEDIESRTVEEYPDPDLPIFPWLAPTRTSNAKENGVKTTPSDVNVLQVFWGMPRRIQLIFEPSEGRRCDITGLEDSIVVTGYRTKNYGVEYSDSWGHPFSPHSQKKTGEPKLPIKGQPDGISYRHWLGLTMKTIGDGKGPTRYPASCIDNFERRAEWLGIKKFNIHCFGYDMDNAKARGWIESEMPVFPVEDSKKEELANQVQRLVNAAEVTANALYVAISRAREPVKTVKDRFWRETERAFFLALHSIINKGQPDEHFGRAVLQQSALRIFDDLVPMQGIEEMRMLDLVRARYTLVQTFRGRNPDGKKLYKALQMPLPPKRKKKDKAA